MNIDTAIQSWKHWATTADTSEEGWQTDFPGWMELADACKRSMLSPHHSSETLQGIDFCWQIAEESEEFADFARAHLPALRDLVIALTSSASPVVRWQAYDILGTLSDAMDAVRRGTQDPDPYVRRRALIAYASDPTRIDDDLLSAVLADTDAYVRRCAWDLARRSRTQTLIERARSALAADDDEIVREVVRHAPAEDP